MTQHSTERPIELHPVAHHARGKRSLVTCLLKCGNQCAHEAPNRSGNAYFRDIAEAALSRRALLGGAGGAAMLLTSATATAGHAAAAPSSTGRPVGTGRGLVFEPIEPVAASVDELTVPTGWTWQSIIRWGDPLFANSPSWDPLHQSSFGQERAFGYNCDYLDIIPLDGNRGRRALLFANHEYTNEELMFPPTTDAATVEENKRIAMMAHGLSVVELQRQAPGRPWSYVRGSSYNRRYTFKTAYSVDGPAAGDALLRTKGDPTGRTIYGTLNNCSGGTTPWGTILSGEENWHSYFVAEGTAENKRYGIPSEPSAGSRAWWTVDERFDARAGTGYEHEVNRFGWIIEVDPFDPDSTPVKHTNLGRFKHEGANVHVGKDRRVAAYTGDDERFEYIYKFVSHGTMQPGNSQKARQQNKTLLSSGDFYVAQFAGNSPADQITGDGALPDDGRFDGTGRWLPLVKNGKSMVAGMSVAEVLVYTRIAADKAGATKMDRPEDVQPNPFTGKVYAALTNNTRRTEAIEPNPRINNRYGHVLEISEDGADVAAETFTWNLLLVCGDPDDPAVNTYFGGYTGKVSPISCPDNVAFDSTGTLWVSTDGAPGTIGYNDALHRVSLDGDNRGKVEQFLAVPIDAETCGPVIHDKDQMVYVCVQHPGEDGSWASPRSFFPDYLPQGDLADGAWGGPRPTVVQIYRD